MITSIRDTIKDLQPPLSKMETIACLDASKLKDAKRCFRYYFYRHYAGWRPDGPQLHLDFGTCWHRAMDVIFSHKGQLDESVIEPAYAAFSDKYEELLENKDVYDKRGAKTKDGAKDMLATYIAKYYGEQHNTLRIEVSGTVPVLADPQRTMHFNMDVVTQDDEGIAVWDHKTGSRLDETWTNQWHLDPQMSLYTHALYCLYEPEKVFGAMINGAIFRKSGNECLRVPLRKSPLEIERFLYDVNRWIDYLEIEHEALLECSPNDEVMQAFPMNEQTCSKWGRTCEYHDFCCTWPNPLKRMMDFYPSAPPGYITEHWDPRERMATAKEVIDIESAN